MIQKKKRNLLEEKKKLLRIDEDERKSRPREKTKVRTPKDKGNLKKEKFTVGKSPKRDKEGSPGGSRDRQLKKEKTSL
jgi:hypothetical protein